MESKKGISLITLIITIVVVVVISGVVILNLANSNPIEKAEKAKIMEDYNAFSSELTLSMGKLVLEGEVKSFSEISTPPYDITELIPSLKDKKINGIDYEKIFTVTGGKVVPKTDLEIETLYPEEAEKIKEVVSEVTEIIEEEKRTDEESNVMPNKPNIELYYLDGTEVEDSKYTKENIKVKIATNVITEGYSMEYRFSYDEEGKWTELNSAETEITINRNCSIIARIVNAEGDEISSSSQNITVIDILDPVITSINVPEDSITETSFIVNVIAEDTAATSEYACSGINEYEYHVIENGTEVATYTSSQATYEVKSLKIGAGYEVYVVAKDKAENVDQSETKLVTMSTTKPTISISTEYTNLKNEDGTEKPLIATIGITSLPEGYVLKYDVGEGEVEASSNITEPKVTNNGTIKAWLENSSLSDKQEAVEKEVTNIDRLSPKTATITEKGKTINSITVTLNGEDADSTVNDGKSGIARYEIYVDGIDTPFIIESENATEEYTINGLESNTTYNLKVKVVDKAGNATLSSSKNIKTSPQIYTITYNSDGGSTTPTAQSKTQGTAITVAEAPTKAGYTFAGWKSSADGKVYAEKASYNVDSNATLTAQWTPITYTITYNLDGGTASNRTTYTIEDEITLTNPTRNGYEFAGWTGSNGTTAQTIVTIAKGSTGDKTYTANWNKIITKQILENEASTYIGKSVTYTGYSESTNTIDWRIYGLDGNGNIMLKANDYVNLSYKISEYPEGISQGNGTYNIKANSSDTSINYTLINYLKDSSKWSEYAVEGKTTARGAMTLPEFVEGYNRVNDEDLYIEELTEGNLTTSDGTYTGRAPGYAIKKGTGSYNYYVNGITEVYNNMKFYISNKGNAKYLWLASASANYSSHVVCVRYNGFVSSTYYGDGNVGVSPVVSLTSAVLVENESGEIEVK